MVQQIWQSNDYDVKQFTGLATDTKPTFATHHCWPGSKFYELDDTTKTVTNIYL